MEVIMGKNDMDWSSIGFNYHVTSERYVRSEERRVGKECG